MKTKKTLTIWRWNHFHVNLCCSRGSIFVLVSNGSSPENSWNKWRWINKHHVNIDKYRGLLHPSHDRWLFACIKNTQRSWSWKHHAVFHLWSICKVWRNWQVPFYKYDCNLSSIFYNMTFSYFAHRTKMDIISIMSPPKKRNLNPKSIL